jgi:NAD(P)-dependent dehydrogenase (short-subunit alcohol dehydrogenase family)/acyl carrier protein
VYLIAGGLGGVGLTLAEHLARAVKARLVLTSRSGLVPREEWDAWVRSHRADDKISLAIGKIRAIEALGAEVMVWSADVADEDQMAAALAAARARFGAVHGVIHAAGVMGAEVFRAASDTTPAHVFTHFRPKVQGLYVLDRVTPPDVDFCLLCSSLSTVVGGVGFLAYAAANHFMDAFAADQRRRGLPWVSVDWDAFQGADRSPLAAFAIRPEEGGLALGAILGLPALDRVIVSTVDLEARRQHLRLLSDASAARPKEAKREGATHARPDLGVEYVAPRDDLERTLAGIWQDLFGIHPVGVNDNFFQLGGDSLMAIQLSTRLRDALGVDIPINELFDEPTIAALAVRIEKARRAGGEAQRAVEATLAMVEGLSDEEVKRMLAELGA